MTACIPSWPLIPTPMSAAGRTEDAVRQVRIDTVCWNVTCRRKHLLMSLLLIMLTSLAPSPMDNVTAFLYFFTKLTTLAFCFGVTRQQITDSHSQAMFTKSIYREEKMICHHVCYALNMWYTHCVIWVLPVSSLFLCRSLAGHPGGCWESGAFPDDEDANDGVSSSFHTESHSEKDRSSQHYLLHFGFWEMKVNSGKQFPHTVEESFIFKLKQSVHFRLIIAIILKKQTDLEWNSPAILQW